MKGYKKFNNLKKINLPETERLYKGIFSLPLYPNIKVSEVKKL